MSNVTHNLKLLVIGNIVIRLCFTKCTMSLTVFLSFLNSNLKMWWDCLSTDVMGFPFTNCVMSLTLNWSYEKILDDETTFHHMCNVTYYFLLVTGRDVMRLQCLLHNMQCYSLPVGHRNKCDETAFHKTCYVTHLLLAIGNHVVGLNVQCHSLAVGQRNRCGKTAFHTMCNVTHSLLIVGKDLMRLPSTKISNVAHLLSVIGKQYIHKTVETYFNVTHILLAIGKFLIRSSFGPLNQHDMLLTCYIYT